MNGRTVAILIPSFNDWTAVRLLLPLIDNALKGTGHRASVLIVDDASTEAEPDDWGADWAFSSIQTVEVLRLRCNLGHQRAIALGLYHLHEFTRSEVVVVMDGDGEDRPEDVVSLLDAFEGAGRDTVVFASRSRRMESAVFQISYRLYQAVHLVLTGIQVRVGNFSVIPRPLLTRALAIPDLWNHYAAAIYRGRLPRKLVRLNRGPRLAGRSRMNFVSLLVHGLGAISVFGDLVSARLLAGSLGLASFVGLGWMLLRFLEPDIPQWAALASGWIFAVLVQCVIVSVLLAFTLIGRRSAPTFILERDAPYFILDHHVVRKAERAGQPSLEAR